MNPYNPLRLQVGLLEVPSDMDTYRPIRSFKASYGQSNFSQYDFFAPPVFSPDRIYVYLVYRNKVGNYTTWKSWYILATDPDRLYYPISAIEEVVLFVYSQKGEVIQLAVAPVSYSYPAVRLFRHTPIVLPSRPIIESSPSPTPLRWSRPRNG